MRRLLAFVRDTRAASAVEFALLLPLMVVVVGGTCDFAFPVMERMRLTAAVRAGAQYAMASPDDAAGIEAAVRAASGLGSATPLTVESFRQCLCPDGTTQACGTTCTGGIKVRSYAVVQVGESFTTPVTRTVLPLGAAASFRID